MRTIIAETTLFFLLCVIPTTSVVMRKSEQLKNPGTKTSGKSTFPASSFRQWSSFQKNNMKVFKLSKEGIENPKNSTQYSKSQKATEGIENLNTQMSGKSTLPASSFRQWSSFQRNNMKVFKPSKEGIENPKTPAQHSKSQEARNFVVEFGLFPKGDVLIIILAAVAIVLAFAIFAILTSRTSSDSAQYKNMAIGVYAVVSDSEEGSGSCTNGSEASSAGPGSGGFPHSLGPFALRPTKWSDPDIQVTTERGSKKSWIIEKNAPLWSSSQELEMFRDSVEEWPIQGRVGQSASVSKFPGPRMVLPFCADTFGWSHPVDIKHKGKGLSEEKLEKMAKSGVAEVDFLLRGGFVFYDSSGQVCGARTMGISSPQYDSLQFGAPQKWHDDLLKKIKSSLIRIPTNDLKDKGAVFYSWVNPDAQVLDSMDAPALPHGGFVYCFGGQSIVQGGPRSKEAPDKNLVFPLIMVTPAQASSGGRKSTSSTVKAAAKAAKNLRQSFGNSWE